MINKMMIEGPRVSMAVVRSTVWPAARKRVGDTAVESLFLSQSYERFVLTIAH